MCGITGVIAFNEKGKESFSLLDNSLKTLALRGPDGEGKYINNNVALGHRRLAIIDTSAVANQPFTDATGRYTIIFNGEFFNFKEHRDKVKDYPLRSSSDTEVLLYLYIKYGAACLEFINGFFALAIYDNVEEKTFIARDRMGIKPLLIYKDENKLLFASEMKALLAFGIPREMDETSLWQYIQFNYIPQPWSIFKNVKKMEAGTFMEIHKGEIRTKRYYSIPLQPPVNPEKDYDKAQQKLEELLDNSVQRRLISDVPLGAFLSGGIDSSVIVVLASRHTKHLNTFSIGYKDEPLFDETKYAELVAKRFNTNHTVFKLSNDDLFDNLYKTLDYIDEPFADSSALAVNILSMHTRKHATVALSGDGADELFGGYNKHAAELRVRKKGITETAVKTLNPLWNALPKSRNSAFGNKVRQLQKFSEGMNLSEKERYWKWASWYDAEQSGKILLTSETQRHRDYNNRKNEILKNINNSGNFNEVLYTDMHLVLQGDMLTKVDLMSMANSLEVRVPFLDYTVVDFAFSLPAEFKINTQTGKRILKDTFRKELPEELYNRGKHGFEVPLLKWFRTGLKSLLMDDLLHKDFIREQGIFNPTEIENLKQKLFSADSGDAATLTWNMLVFQYWWKKNMT
ncbi:MAG: Asparagine synthetase [glutamine-hydrolyzing] 1 [Bacteroidia bacterium]|nr:Asparagine synthetase [glutamine-hydrolyzing] 1 [Bacteroidia bacterium]